MNYDNSEEITQPISIPPKLDRLEIIEAKVIDLENQVKYLTTLLDRKENKIYGYHISFKD